MMNKLKTSFLLFILSVSLSTCIVDDAEYKPDPTQPANEMVYKSSSLIHSTINMFDKILFLDSYLSLEDSMKSVFKNQYNLQFRIENPESNLYYFIRPMAIDTTNTFLKDTIYTILTDTNSIHLKGAIWKIKKQYQDSFCRINCIGKEKWEIHKDEQTYLWKKYLSKYNLQLECRDTIPALLFRTSSFNITGSGVSKEKSVYFNQIQSISFQIKDPLVYQASIQSITEGSLDITADNLQNNKLETTYGRYFIDSDSVCKFEITYHNRTKIYNYSSWNYW